ncbi:NTP/NDP exchange transporter [Noviherbaspirillum malthae]|uniref:NTP/NDP exchange transporter n=1 Tax=Noviherbaspirillum malthae TaxID=1260987 RepID=UPI00188FC60D|nr:MFS transporter [Noviherbaspirillum malthae]
MERSERPRSLRSILLGIRSNEPPAVCAGFLMLFSLFASYFMLRPVRETMGIAGGVDKLQWLFTGTFIATLAAAPVIGWAVSKIRRRYICHWVLGFFALNTVAFGLAFAAYGDAPWLARSFFIWLSVFNLAAISIAWSVLADIFQAEQARRLFALMSAGASLGGLAGPLAGAMLVNRIGNEGLLMLAAAILLVTISCSEVLQRWRDRFPPEHSEEAASQTLDSRNARLGGSALAGAADVLRSPFLLGVALFVVLLASVSTFLYLEQARLVAERFQSRTEQTQFFSMVDAVVQLLSLLIQFLLTARIATAFGLRALLLGLPLAMVAGFLLLSVSPLFALFIVILVIRRVGEYALVKPGREMLFTVLPPQLKYKAKNFIDTVVYRGADAISAWLKSLADLMLSPQAVPLLGACIAAAWAVSAVLIARAYCRLDAAAGSGTARERTCAE